MGNAERGNEEARNVELGRRRFTRNPKYFFVVKCVY